MTPQQAASMLERVRTEEGWEVGETLTPSMTGTVKVNKELKKYKSDGLSYELRRYIMKVKDLGRDVRICSLLVPKFNKYDVGDAYHRHLDHSHMSGMRTDLSATIFLTPQDEYDGGVLTVELPSGETVELRGDPGEIVVYPSWHVHWVTPVTRGTRISAITWFNSYVRDPLQRDLIRLLERIGLALEKEKHPFGPSVSTCSHQLFRMWADNTLTDRPSPATRK